MGDLTQARPDDLTPEQRQMLDDFISNGSMGIGTIKDSDIAKWCNLYMEGNSYDQIAKKCKKDVVYVLYLASRGKWYEKRMQYWAQLSNDLVDKMAIVKTQVTDTTATIIQALSIYFKTKFEKYIATRDEEYLDEINMNMLTQYSKFIDMINRNGFVNINVDSNGTQITSGKTAINISSDKEASDILKQLANNKRKERSDN